NLFNLTVINKTLFFTAYDGVHGSELWKSDGTESGTVMVKDINPGSSGSYPYDQTVVKGTLFFTADDGTTGRELWKSDGTEAGTVLVKDILPEGQFTDGSFPQSLTDANVTLSFSANDGVSGRELGKSDGTAVGTVLVKDINP